ncbi:unnamed protein product [Amoebophrya sp. A25]|nr:unnamed protein product [Amoebophrya sp. A25]|eukprot:GSA25T00009724001.1
MSQDPVADTRFGSSDVMADTLLPGGGGQTQMDITRFGAIGGGIDATQLPAAQHTLIGGDRGSPNINQTRLNGQHQQRALAGPGAELNTQLNRFQEEADIDGPAALDPKIVIQQPETPPRASQELNDVAEPTPPRPPSAPGYQEHVVMEWTFDWLRYLITLIGAFLSFLVPLCAVSFRNSDGFAVWLLCTWFLILVTASVPVTGWEAIRPLSQVEIGNAIFNPPSAKDDDLYLTVARRDLFLFVMWVGVLQLCCFFVVEYPIASRAVLYVVLGLAFYFYYMTELLLNKYSNHPRRLLFHAKFAQSPFVPDSFLDGKIARTWLDFTRFGLFVFFFTCGVVIGQYNRERSAGPALQMANGRSYSYVEATDAMEDLYDGSLFRFTPDTKVDAFRSFGYKENANTYCSAPILETATASAPVYTWAVGKNCCMPRGDFWCTAEFAYEVQASDDEPSVLWGKTGKTREAVRAFVPDADRLGYIRSVRSAIASYGFPQIVDEHVVKLVFWTPDAAAIETSLRRRGATFVLVVLSLFLVLAGAFALAPGAGIVRRIVVIDRERRGLR